MPPAKQLLPQPVVNAIGGDFPMRILIVEDNKVNLQVLKQILQRMGYESDVAENGLQAIDAVQQKSYDLIFMDLQMPLMGGIEATLRIREITGENGPAITAFTANSHQSDRIACKGVGMDDFIAKPATPKRIEEVIRSIFIKRHTDADPFLKID